MDAVQCRRSSSLPDHCLPRAAPATPPPLLPPPQPPEFCRGNFIEKKIAEVPASTNRVLLSLPESCFASRNLRDLSCCDL